MVAMITEIMAVIAVIIANTSSGVGFTLALPFIGVIIAYKNVLGGECYVFGSNDC